MWNGCVVSVSSQHQFPSLSATGNQISVGWKKGGVRVAKPRVWLGYAHPAWLVEQIPQQFGGGGEGECLVPQHGPVQGAMTMDVENKRHFLEVKGTSPRYAHIHLGGRNSQVFLGL